MKNVKIILLTTVLSSTLFAAEAPPKPPRPQSPSYISQLPQELRTELIQYTLYGTGYPDIPAFVNLISTMQDKITPDVLLALLETLPTAIGLELAQQVLQKIPAYNNPRITNWIETEKTQLINGQQLFNAAVKGQVEQVKNFLANKYINVNWRNTRKGYGQGLTPLLRVVSLSLPEETVAEIVDALLKGGANPNVASETKTNGGNQNWTALMVAAGKGNEAVVAMLLKAKANVNAQDVYGDTALIEAANKGHTRIVKMLLEAGADPLIKNRNGDTAYDAAFNSEVEQLLKAAMLKSPSI